MTEQQPSDTDPTQTQRIVARQLVPGRGAPVADAVVVLDGGSITYAGPAADAPDTPNAVVTTCDTVMPGMWDAHVHLMGVPDLELSKVATHRVEPAMLRVAADASRALRMGFTSLREVGGHGVHVEAVRREGLVRAPRVYSSNAILSTTGGHGDLHDLPLDLVERFGADGGLLAIADGIPEVLKAVRRQLRLDAKLIKVCASGGVLSEVDHPMHQQFSGEELKAIVEEATRAERIVAAHCHGEAGIEAAIEAGVHTIEHGTYLTEDTAAAMVEREMVLVPTRTIVDTLFHGESAGAGGASPRMMEKGRAITARHEQAIGIAMAAGVTIASGTDLGLSVVGHPLAFGGNARELELLVELGMTSLQAIDAATATGPATLGPQAPRSGQLVEGYDADVLALSADPVADISVLRDPASIVGVWLAGERVVAARDGVPELTPMPLR